MAKKSAKKKAAKSAPKRAAKKPARAARHRSVAADAPHPEDHIDACDIDFAAAKPTHDSELPMAIGGVAAAPRKSKRR
jgi:hypothetical protein